MSSGVQQSFSKLHSLSLSFDVRYSDVIKQLIDRNSDLRSFTLRGVSASKEILSSLSLLHLLKSLEVTADEGIVMQDLLSLIRGKCRSSLTQVRILNLRLDQSSVIQMKQELTMMAEETGQKVGSIAIDRYTLSCVLA